MPKNYMEETIAWLNAKYEEAEQDMLEAEEEDNGDYAFHWGRYEAYGHALARIGDMYHGKD